MDNIIIIFYLFLLINFLGIERHLQRQPPTLSSRAYLEIRQLKNTTPSPLHHSPSLSPPLLSHTQFPRRSRPSQRLPQEIRLSSPFSSPLSLPRRFPHSPRGPQATERSGAGACSRAGLRNDAERQNNGGLLFGRAFVGQDADG
jgi:hypothetical protein